MINLEMVNQPDDSTCGPTCLHAVYQYYNDPLPLDNIINEIKMLKNGGTLAVFLASHALKRNYNTTIYNYNLNLFDPIWFKDPEISIAEKLNQQRLRKSHDEKLTVSSIAYEEYLKLGGKMLFKDLTPSFLRKLIYKNVPVLVGLNATYLYECSREITDENNNIVFDDVGGFSSGHFVVLCGMDQNENVVISDPYYANPFSESNIYTINVHKFINSVMLGVITFDANLLIIEPK